MKLAFIENHDSFSFTLIDYFKRFDAEVIVIDHNQEPNLSQISHLVLGPGPGTPQNSGKLMSWLQTGIKTKIPILGVCLGHQAIGEYFGAKLVRASRAIHGEIDLIQHSGQRLFANIPNPTPVTRYHSLVLQNLPSCLIQDAVSQDGQIMAISHESLPIFGLQFHPESFLSQDGLEMLRNFRSISFLQTRV